MGFREDWDNACKEYYGLTIGEKIGAVFVFSLMFTVFIGLVILATLILIAYPLLFVIILLPIIVVAIVMMTISMHGKTVLRKEQIKNEL